MNVLLTGAAGQLGRELTALLRARHALTTTDRIAGDGDVDVLADLADRDTALALLNDRRPALVINPAAFTAVDAAESQREAAWRLNAEVPGWLADWARQNGAMLVHFSTDYVFDGDTERPWREDDEPAPLNVYGESKLAGERAVLDSGCRCLLIRTAWVYSSHGRNFLRTMLRLARDRDRLSVVDDQVGCPTWARNLARVVLQVVEQDRRGSPGLLHYTDRDPVSWFDFAQRIFTLAHARGLLERVPELEPVGTETFPTPARRPRYSVLDSSAIERRYGVEPAGLDASLKQCLEELES